MPELADAPVVPAALPPARSRAPIPAPPAPAPSIPGDDDEEAIVAASEMPAEVAKAIKDFNKKRGGQSRIFLASQKPICNHISTGIFAIDLATLGGFPENTPFMIYGLNSAAKTTMMLKTVAKFQHKYPDMFCGWVDAETSFDPIWAAKHGVDLDRLYMCQPESGEEAVDMVEMYLRSADISFVVIDSIPALVPKARIEDSAEEKKYGGNSPLIGILMSKYLAAVSEERLRGHYPTLGVVNQIRDNMSPHGSPYKIPGGKQLTYQVNTWVRLKGLKKLGKDRWGQDVADHLEQSFVIEKAKVGSSLISGEYKMALNPHFCKDSSIPAGLEIPMGAVYELKTVLAQGKRMGFITGSGGNWNIHEVDQRFRKLEDMEIFLYQNPMHDLRLRQLMIGAYRRENGLPILPPDGFLLSWDQYE